MHRLPIYVTLRSGSVTSALVKKREKKRLRGREKMIFQFRKYGGNWVYDILYVNLFQSVDEVPRLGILYSRFG